MVGMAGVYGIDKYKLESLAERRGIHLYKYDTFVDGYISKVISKINKSKDEIPSS